ncbi:MAG: hypothetical protein EA427_00205, partial [Spirochaetaceae bacterium]
MTTGNLSIITAGAGSGKTTRIVGRIVEAIRSGIEPERIIAITFTRRAAAELQQRIHSSLVEAAMLDAARQLQGALVGTVHSVSGTLVERYSYSLGLSPSLAVIDEVEAKAAFSRASEAALDGTVRRRLYTLQSRLTTEYAKSVRSIVDLTRANGINPASLEESARRSRAELDRVLPVADTDLESVVTALRQEIPRALAAIPASDTTNATAKARLSLEHALSRFDSAIDTVPWRLLSGLATIEAGAKSRETVERLQEIAGRYQFCREYREEILEYTQLVFDVATRSLEEYQRYKRERGLLDFNDQEALLLDAITRPDVARDLAESFDLLVVDEFQDTSPLQLALFMRFLEIGLNVIWVGDPKQSIYGFRDADPSLLTALIEAFPGANSETLSVSYRSNPDLVSFTNRVFGNAFSVTMPAMPVALTAHRPAPEGGERSILLWQREYDKERRKDADLYRDLVLRIRRLLDQGGSSADIAILCRDNKHCTEVAEALVSLGVPALLVRPGLMKTPEAILLCACLRYLADPRDTQALAEIRLLTEDYRTPGDLLRDVLTEQQGSGEQSMLQANDLIRLLDEIRPDIPSLSVTALADTVIARTELHRRVMTFGAEDQVAANIDVLRRHITTYVERTATEGRDATVDGAVRALDEIASAHEDEQPVPLGSAGVTVLTYHGAKGLEWPTVVAMELDKGPRETVYAIEATREREELDP